MRVTFGFSYHDIGSGIKELLDHCLIIFSIIQPRSFNLLINPTSTFAIQSTQLQLLILSRFYIITPQQT